MSKKMKLIVLTLSALLIMVGCGGGGSTTDSGTITNSGSSTDPIVSKSTQYILLPETNTTDFSGAYIEDGNAIYAFGDTTIYNIDGIEYRITVTDGNTYTLTQGSDFIKVTKIDSDNYTIDLSDGSSYQYNSMTEQVSEENGIPTTVTPNGYEGIWYDATDLTNVEIYYIYTDKIKIFRANYNTGICTFNSDITGITNVNNTINSNLESDVIEKASGAEYTQAEGACGNYGTLATSISLRLSKQPLIIQSNKAISYEDLLDNTIKTMGNVFETYLPLNIIKQAVDGVKSRVENLNSKFKNMVDKVSTFKDKIRTGFNTYADTLKSDITEGKEYQVGVVGDTQVNTIKADTLGTTSQVVTYLESENPDDIQAFEATGATTIASVDTTAEATGEANVYCMKNFRDSNDILAVQQGMCTTSNDECKALGADFHNFVATTAEQCQATCENNAIDPIHFATADVDGSNALYFTTECLAPESTFSNESKVPLTAEEACAAGFQEACENKNDWVEAESWMDWYEAMNFCESQRMKLPNKSELEAIWKSGGWGDITGVYWSSTTREGYENSAWYVYFGLDWVGTASKDTDRYYARCIRDE